MKISQLIRCLKEYLTKGDFEVVIFIDDTYHLGKVDRIDIGPVYLGEKPYEENHTCGEDCLILNTTDRPPSEYIPPVTPKYEEKLRWSALAVLLEQYAEAENSSPPDIKTVAKIQTRLYNLINGIEDETP